MLDHEYPKVLFISHNAFSKTLNNGKTFSSLFSGWPKDKIAQLYFHNEHPDFDVCENYFIITDEQILKRKKIEVGQIITRGNVVNVKKTQSPLHSYVRKKPMSIFTMLRDIIWDSKKWDNLRFQKWVENFSPDIIFFVGGGSKFSYKITKKIADKYGIPVLLYYTDDYITMGPSLDVFGWINQIRLRLYLKKFMPVVKKIFVIGEDMKHEYSLRFKKDCIPIMNSVNISGFEKIDRYINLSKVKNSINIAYFGGLHLNRWVTLEKLGIAMRNLYENNAIQFRLFVYTNQKPDTEIYTKINYPPFIQYMGSVDQNEIINEMNKYDILIHAESFERKMTYKTRLSISTKIPEYLATGKPILGVGPSTLSSIKYLKSSTDSFILEDLSESSINDILIDIYRSKENFASIGKKNIIFAKKNHSIEKERSKVKNVILDSVYSCN